MLIALKSALELRSAGHHDAARVQLSELAKKYPDDANIQYQAACVHDFLGLEAEAVPFYLRSLGGTLSPVDRLGALHGLGSTYRTLGRYSEAEAILLQALKEFPNANEVKVFLAMVHHNQGRSKEAVESLLQILAETSTDEGIQQYSRAIALYAKDIDQVWPEHAT